MLAAKLTAEHDMAACVGSSGLGACILFCSCTVLHLLFSFPFLRFQHQNCINSSSLSLCTTSVESQPDVHFS